MPIEAIPEFDDLEVRISRSRATRGLAGNLHTLRGDPRESEAYLVEVRMANDEPRSAVLSVPPVLRPEAGSKAYGIELFKWLLPDGELRQALRQARWSAESFAHMGSNASGVRLRLWLDPNAPELQSVRWEALRDADRDEPLSLTMAFSRFMLVPGLTDSRSRERPLRLLLITADPESVDRSSPFGVDVDLQSPIAEQAMERYGHLLQIQRLRQGWGSIAEIRSAEPGESDIVHILGHALAQPSDSSPDLADAHGALWNIGCSEMVAALTEGRRAPYLVVLPTPASAGEHENAVLLELAQALIKGGVRAVLAISAPLRDESLRLFMERFYSLVLQSGIVDQAVADARVAIYRADKPEEWDWALPLLYLRTQDPRMFLSVPRAFETLLSRISS